MGCCSLAVKPSAALSLVLSLRVFILLQGCLSSGLKQLGYDPASSAQQQEIASINVPESSKILAPAVYWHPEKFLDFSGRPRENSVLQEKWRGVAPTISYVSPGPTWLFDHPLSNPATVQHESTGCTDRQSRAPIFTRDRKNCTDNRVNISLCCADTVGISHQLPAGHCLC